MAKHQSHDKVMLQWKHPNVEDFFWINENGVIFQGLYAHPLLRLGSLVCNFRAGKNS